MEKQKDTNEGEKMFERRTQIIFFWNYFEKYVVQAERRNLKQQNLIHWVVEGLQGIRTLSRRVQ